MSDDGRGDLTFQPLGAAPEPAPPARPPRRAPRWRWEHLAVLLWLVFVAAMAGLRNDVLGDLGRGATMNLLAMDALSRRDPAAQTELWQRLRLYRLHDDRYQSTVGWQLYLASREAGQQDVAATVLRELMARGLADRGDANSALVLGSIALQQGAVDVAVAQLEAGLRRGDGHSPVDFELRNALSTAYDRLGRRAAAEQLLLGLVDAYPDDPMPYNNLGYHYAEHGEQLDEAERLVRQALAMEQRQAVLSLSVLSGRHKLIRATYLDSLGWVHYKQGHLDQAKEELTRAVKMTEAEPNAEILYHLAQLYFDRGSDLTAQQLISKALKADPEFEPAVRLQEQIDGAGRLNGPIT